MSLKTQEYILSTIYRAENTDNSKRRSNIFKGLLLLAAETTVILPLHPRTRKALQVLNWCSDEKATCW